MPFNPTFGTIGAHGPLKPYEWNTPPGQQTPLTGTGGSGGSGGGSWASASYITPGYQSNLQISYYDVQEPAGSLYTVPEEDSWVTFVPPAFARTPVQISYAALQPWSFDYVEIPSPVQPVVPDVEYWVSGVAPVQASYVYPQQWQFDPMDWSQMLGGSGDASWAATTYVSAYSNAKLSTLYGSEDAPQMFFVLQPDEDFWTNNVQPVQSTYVYPQQWTFSEGTETVQPVVFQPDEDYWILQPQQQLGVLPPAYEPTIFWYEEDLDLVFQPDEDYWQNTVQAVVLTFQPLQQSVFSEDLVIPEGFPIDEYWQNYVTVVQSVYGVPQQWTFDEQIPAGSLIGTVDEDFWFSWVTPISATYYQTLPYGFGADRGTDFIPFTPTPPATGRSARLGFSFPHFR